jgi:pantetheine-phosphate adenylyltransferase, bacterial
MVKAVFAGSFDPPTYGHLNVIDRAEKIFAEIHIVIAVNKDKDYLFSGEERKKMMDALTAGKKNIVVTTWDALIVEYAKKIEAKVLIRGVRNVSDFSYEFDLAIMNKGLDNDIETVFLLPDPKYFVLRSSSIKELASFGGNLSGLVPPLVKKALKERLQLKPECCKK